ncbi:AAA family ATPase [Flagellimonas oceanensis]|uniref:AAA family ATPase n=1 Tax=Flagellimonas oceanensis TaxID=2499163 RepID=UPI003BA87365|tara:strand:+ start:692 stop:1732 length:1041 start_codon:yes stop_codon:yes gene_type:complete
MNQLTLKNFSFLEGGIILNPELIYFSYFEKIPNEVGHFDIETSNLLQEFRQEFEKKILAYHYKTDRSNYCVPEHGHVFILTNEILVRINYRGLSVLFSEETLQVQLIEEFCIKFKQKEKKTDLAQINLITSGKGNFENRIIDFKKPEVDLNHLYNDDFNDFHRKILSVLLEENTSGLHLLHGIPGTGKSTYIRYLCGLLKKKVIFLPGEIARNLDNVYMMRYLLSNSNSILIIEDAEELIVSRDHQRNSNLAMILNLTDGILGESLGIQIIATFNTDLKKIDPALKRKGRLKSSYEFKALTFQKANALLKKEGVEETTNDPLTLAEIFNFKEDQQMEEPIRKTIGF